MHAPETFQPSEASSRARAARTDTGLFGLSSAPRTSSAREMLRLARQALVAALFLGAAACPPADSGSMADEEALADEGMAGTSQTAAPVADVDWGIVIHGGAGTIERSSMTPEREAEYRAKLTEALQAGHEVLEGGGSALDAVVATIQVMEESPLFNSGKGAVFTADGTNSLDASIMDGATGAAGAVAGVAVVKSPIALARLVMEESPHVMLSGAGAEAFARLQGAEIVDPSYFHTDRRWQELQDARAAEMSSDGSGGLAAADFQVDGKFSTVGAIALDRSGNVAAGTSTGGMTNKKWGRIGDSPVIGAGTYANQSCGISSTGWGEYFIRNVVAYDICARMKYTGASLAESAAAVVADLKAQAVNTGGIVGLDGDGHIVWSFNTPGMYRGFVDQDGQVRVEIYEMGDSEGARGGN